MPGNLGGTRPCRLRIAEAAGRERRRPGRADRRAVVGAASGAAVGRGRRRGETAAEMDRVLHAPQLAAYNDGLNALTAHIASRAGRRPSAGGKVVDVELGVANSLWGHQQTAWEQAFLDDLARHYGAGMQLVDYGRATEAARRRINEWVGERTRKRIPELVPSGVLDADTRLVLVNAIYLKAPWFRRFEPSATATRPFTRADGRVLQVPTMSAPTMSGRYTRGPGWQAVDLPYAGQQLAMAVVLPDPGRLADVERAFDGAMLARVLSGFSPATVDLQLPRWTARTKVDLVGVLAEMGMPRAMSAVADFSGMTRAERLAIGAVPHETFVEVTEKGTEAAAATAVKVGWVSAGPPRLPVAVDRTFLYVIHDVATATPLFVGRVDDPTAG